MIISAKNWSSVSKTVVVIFQEDWEWTTDRHCSGSSMSTSNNQLCLPTYCIKKEVTISLEFTYTKGTNFYLLAIGVLEPKELGNKKLYKMLKWALWYWTSCQIIFIRYINYYTYPSITYYSCILTQLWISINIIVIIMLMKFVPIQIVPCAKYM